MTNGMNSDQQENIELSIISPVFNGACLVEQLVDEITKAIQHSIKSYEIILVEDGSPDDSWDAILRVSRRNANIYGIRLSRNYGQHNAIRAGLEAATGEWITVLDCDLQDDPKGIPTLLREAKSGYDIVMARRVNRKDNKGKRMSSKAFNSVFSALLSTPISQGVGNFGVYSRRSIDCILDGEQAVNYFPAMISNAGFRTKTVSIEHRMRASGESNYSLRRLLKLSIGSMIGFSEKPIRLLAFGGFLISATACVAALFYLGAFLAGYTTIKGYTSIVILLFLTFGLNMLMLGVIGLYVGKTLELSKRRRPYYILETSRVNAK